MLKKMIIIVAGGGIGSGCRYLFSFLAARWFGDSLPWGTMGVNLIGSLLIGFCFALAEKSLLSPAARLLVITGFLGGFTTFSTFALESSVFYQTGNFTGFFYNVVLNNFLGLLLVFIGMKLGEIV